MRKAITEEDKIHNDWYKEAEHMTLEKLPKFLKKLTEEYEHDYGTICHVLVAGAIATMRSLDRTDQGGITGFQASCIMWEFIRQWMQYEIPMKLMKFDNMLYPQYQDRFEKTITEDTWKWLQKEAKKKFRGKDGHPDIRKHWESIVNGKIPFGYTISTDA